MLAIVHPIVTQHTEESAFLWILRNNAIRAPHYALKDLAKSDNRIDAHLEGLRIAGDTGWELCAEALASGEAGEVFTAAVMALESGDAQRIQTVLDVAVTRRIKGTLPLKWLRGTLPFIYRCPSR